MVSVLGLVPGQVYLVSFVCVEQKDEDVRVGAVGLYKWGVSIL